MHVENVSLVLSLGTARALQSVRPRGVQSVSAGVVKAAACPALAISRLSPRPPTTSLPSHWCRKRPRRRYYPETNTNSFGAIVSQSFFLFKMTTRDFFFILSGYVGFGGVVVLCFFVLFFEDIVCPRVSGIFSAGFPTAHERQGITADVGSISFDEGLAILLTYSSAESD